MKIKIPQIKNVIFFGGNPVYFNVIKSFEKHAISFKIIAPSPIDEVNDAEIIVDKNLETGINKLGGIQNMVAFSVGSPWIFSKSILERLNNLVFNVHPSNLPVNRGRAVPTWKILDQDYTNTVTLHQVTPVIDDGPIVDSKSVDLEKDALPIDFENSTKTLAKILINEFLSSYKHGGDCLLRPNPIENSTYWPGLKTSRQSYINWSWNCIQIKQFIHAFSSPFRGAQTYVNKSHVYVQGKVGKGDQHEFHPFKIGVIYKKLDNNYYVACRTGNLIIPESCVTIENGDIANLSIGDRFYTPPELLIEAKKSRFSNRDFNPDVY